MQQLVEGHPTTWREFIDRYGSLIRSRVADVAITMGKGSDWATIDDITAEVFASLITNDSAALRAFAFRSGLGTYLAVIATRVARRNLFRSLRLPSQQWSEDSTDTSPADPSTSPEQTAISQEQVQQILSSVNRLPDAWRQIVISHYRDGMTYQQISEKHGVPLGSIGTTLRRAEQRIRSWIEQETTP